MFLSFKQKKNYTSNEKLTGQDRIAQRIVNRCLSVQDKASKFLQHKSEYLTLKTKRISVAAFCFLSASCCLYIVLKNFTSKSKPFLINALKVPTQPQTKFQSGRHPIISKEGLNQMQRLRFVIDSLSKSEAGKKVLDSIIISYPGLFGTVTMLENMYQRNH